MIVDRQGIGQAESKLAAHSPPPSTVEELRAFLGMTGYLRQFVEGYSMRTAILTDILRNKAFASKLARRSPIPSLEYHINAKFCP